MLIKQAAQGLRLPSSCWVCHSWSKEPVCDRCIRPFAAQRQRCRTCAAALCISQVQRCGACMSLGSALEACAAAVDYAYPWDRLIQRFKYADHGNLSASPGLAKPLAQVMHTLARSDAQLADALHRAMREGWIAAVPLHPSRQQARGFNQAHELAKALFPGSRRIRSDLLLRVQVTAAQANLPRDARVLNLRHAFAANPERIGDIRGQSITLVDDVATTTATVQSAALALRQAGAASVQAIVLARAP